MINANELKIGDVLSTGAFGCTIVYARILRITPKGFLRVIHENGQSSLKHPSFFNDKIIDKEVAELRAEGINI